MPLIVTPFFSWVHKFDIAAICGEGSPARNVTDEQAWHVSLFPAVCDSIFIRSAALVLLCWAALHAASRRCQELDASLVDCLALFPYIYLYRFSIPFYTTACIYQGEALLVKISG